MAKHKVNEMENRIIQLSAGRGPQECTWVVAQVLKYIIKEIKTKNLKFEIIEREIGKENGTLQSVYLKIQGKQLDVFLKDWLGTIQWIGQSQYRKMHKRKNWFIAIKEIDNVLDEIELRDSDIRYQSSQSSGPGGQHVNRVNTAIRAIHLPTGLSVTSSKERSQLRNKKEAKRKLQLLLHSRRQEELQKQVKQSWKNHTEIERGSPIRIFKGGDFKPIKVNKNYKARRQQLKKELSSRWQE